MFRRLCLTWSFVLLGTHSPANFEDAESSNSSSVTNSPALSFPSCSTTPEVCPSPPVQAFVQPSPCGAVRKRGSRLAAKFSNPGVDGDSDESTKNNNHIEVFMSAARPLAPFGLRNDHLPRVVSINSLNPSQRILDSDLLRPEDLYNSSTTSDDSFEYKYEDFPPLK